jgi:hypothetical protein
MGYNVFLERIWPIPSKTEALGTEIVVAIPTDNDKRITIPSLLVRCGATAQTFTVLQVKTLDYVALDAAGGQAEVTIQETTESLAGRFAAIKLPDGSLFFSKITASAAKVQTLTDNLPAGGVKKDARFMIFATAAEDGNNSMLLEASADTSLQAPCPGLFAGKDIGFPVILHLTNATHQAKILGGMVGYIGK